MKILSVLLVLLASACASSAQYTYTTRETINVTESVVMDQFGKPQMMRMIGRTMSIERSRPSTEKEKKIFKQDGK